MEALTPCELFECGAEGEWSNELYRLPPSNPLQPYPGQQGYILHDQKEDAAIGCVDPRSIWSEDGDDVDYGSEDEDDGPQPSPGNNGTSRESRECEGGDRRECLVCHVRKYHFCTCDSEDTPISPLRHAAATTTEWVSHNTPLLQEYAERQIAPPLIDRVNIELNHPTQFVRGALQMLSNRSKDSDEPVHPTRRLEPQLLDGFVDIHKLANEYLRSQFDQELVGDLVPILLTIITNNFYEAHMCLMDDIVRQALANMDARKGPCLEVKDFVFGFDLHMRQDIPFFVDVNHRVRDTLESLRPKPSVNTRLREPQTTRYGRTTKPTQRQAESEVKKTRKTATKKKAEQAGTAQPDAENVTPTPEPTSTTGRPRKSLPARAPKPKNPKQPGAPTSSNVSRRPKKSVVGRMKVPGKEQDEQSHSPTPSQSFESPPFVTSPIVEGLGMTQPFASSLTRSQAPGVEAQPQIQAPPDTLAGAAAPRAVPTQLQASTPSATHSHTSQPATQPLLPIPPTTDAQLFEFIVWPAEKASSTDGQAFQEDSHSRCSTPPSSDYGGVNDTLSEATTQRPGASASLPLKLETVENLLQWDKGSQESKTTSAMASAAEDPAEFHKTPGRDILNETDGQPPPPPHRISPLATLLTNIRICDVTEGESSSSGTLLTESVVSTPTEFVSAGSFLAPTSSLEEGQTPDTVTLAGYDSDVTDATVSTLVTSHVPTPEVDVQKLKSTRRTPHPRTAEPMDAQASWQRLTIKVPPQSLTREGTPTAEPDTLAQSQPSTTSTSQPYRRSLRVRQRGVQIPTSTSSSSRPSQNHATMDPGNPVLSPLSAVGAATFTPEPEPRVSKKRKLGRPT